MVKHYRPRIIYDNPVNHPKLIPATEIPMKEPFDYKRFHDEVRNHDIYPRSRRPGARKIPEITSDDRPTRQKGALRRACSRLRSKPSATRTGFRSGENISSMTNFRNIYSKAIIATDLPGYEIIIYLRSRQKKEYHKMVQSKDGHFKFERPTPPKVGFFLWLDAIQPSLGARATLGILETFSIATPAKTEESQRQILSSPGS